MKSKSGDGEDGKHVMGEGGDSLRSEMSAVEGLLPLLFSPCFLLPLLSPANTHCSEFPLPCGTPAPLPFPGTARGHGSHPSFVPAPFITLNIHVSIPFPQLLRVSVPHPPLTNTMAATLRQPTAMSETPDQLATRVQNLSTAPTTTQRTGSGSAVLENGTNIGSAAGRKASIPAQVDPERIISTSGSGRTSRRGSGLVMTPGGVQTVYHTRTNVCHKHRDAQWI